MKEGIKGRLEKIYKDNPLFRLRLYKGEKLLHTARS
jgi:hypothetical protein